MRSSKMKLTKSNNQLNAMRMFRLLIATTSLCIILLMTIMIFSPISSIRAANTSPNTSSTNNINANLTSPSQSNSKATTTTTTDQSKVTQTTTILGTNDSSKSSPSSSPSTKTKNNGDQHTIEQQQQSTDLSSMYVQIPIAEPGDTMTGTQDGVQHTLTGNEADSGSSGGDPSKATSWTGPWPKKFQIGYIKQSDLHQVLIESLKNDPFVSITGPAAGATSSGLQSGTKSGATSTPPPAIAGQSKKSLSGSISSDSSTLMVPQAPLQESIPTPQWPTLAMQSTSNFQRQQQFPRPQQNLNKNVYHHQAMMKQAFRQDQQLKSQQPPFPMHRFQQQMNFNQQPRNNFVNFQQQQHPKLISMTGNSFRQHHQQPQLKPPQLQQQQHQFQFAGFPSNAFKNQPIYTINNYPHHEQLDQQQLVVPNGGQPQYSNNVAQQMVSAAPRPQKSSDYYSSWKPVTSEKSEPTTSGNKFNIISGSNGQFQTDYTSLNDGFDDGFNTPSSGKDSSTSSMNRHPMLNTYLSSNSNSANNIDQQQASSPNKTSNKVSPAMRIKQQLQGETKSHQQQQGATKGASKSGDSSQQTKSTAIKSIANDSPGSGVKGGTDSSMELSGSRRRAQNGTATGASTTTSASTSGANSNATSTTTLNPTSADSDSVTTSTTTLPSTTTSSSSSITTTTVESETQEPDSEVIESDTTEPSTATTTTTTATTSSTGTSTTSLTSSTTAKAGAGNNSSTQNGDNQDGSQGSSTVNSVDSSSAATGSQSTLANGQSAAPSATASDNGESEVVTQGSIQQQSSGTASLPAVNIGSGGGQQTVTDENGGFSQASIQRGLSATPTSTTLSSASTTTAATGSSREETTPSTGGSSTTNNIDNDGTSTNGAANPKTSSNGEVEGSDSANESNSGTNKRSSLNRDNNMDSMSDEALLAASVKTGSEIAKNEAMQAMNLQRQRVGSSSTSKRTRSSERLQQQQAAAGGKKGSSSNNSGSGSKLITKRPNSNSSSGNRTGKQVSADSVKGSSAKLSDSRQKNRNKNLNNNNNNKKRPVKTNNSSQKATRMVNQSEKLLQSQQPQVVSMSAAQAQSTAQTLASLLLSRCMNSANCAHLLDMCTTKQAIIPLNLAGTSNNISNNNNDLSSNADLSTNITGWSMPVGLMSSTIMSLTQSLQADNVLKVFPQWKDAIENVVDHDTQSGYTLILPSNEAIQRLPEATIDSWLANSDLMAQIIDNHMIDSSELIEFNNGAFNNGNSNGRSTTSTPKTRVIRSKGLQVNQHRDKMVTINGKRLVYANQAAPSGGRIHVIEGVLDWPVGGGFAQAKLLDIMDTLKQCDKFDGFVTLAEGTGLTQILKQDGPMTVFVPSNEALRKIPDEELEVIKNNSTALKEFLMYHVVNGSYFSQDLRDGQQLASIFDMKPIQVGVRVDGCSRRLVEANTSPMRRPDIVAKNGVIHILDWYLTVRDNEWCDPINRADFTATNSVSTTSKVPSSTSERLQQLASEQQLGQPATISYATRMTMPANHKPATNNVVASNHQSISPNSLLSVASSITGGLETNNIVVSATPLADINRAASAKA